MTKHFFTFRKFQNGQPTKIHIEVWVACASRAEAREIAEQEMDEWREAKRLREVLRRETERLEASVRRLPDYRFVGVN